LKDLEDRFAEIEKRVRALVTENKSFRGRIKELEHELAQARREAQDRELFNGKKLHIKEKVERILQSLETVNHKE
jgi:chromosome segregation ATPase